jgi:predicted DNA-binding protein
MSTQVVVTLADETYRRVEQLARLTGQDIAELLAATIDTSLPDLSTEFMAAKPVSDLSDSEVLALSESWMESAQSERFSALLYKQQAGTLEQSERSELMTLLQVYQEGLLRKAMGLNEAVRRGLRKPLEP